MVFADIFDICFSQIAFVVVGDSDQRIALERYLFYLNSRNVVVGSDYYSLL